MLRLVSEVPVLEDTLMRVLVIGLTQGLRVNPQDSIDIAENIVRRAAQLHADGTFNAVCDVISCVCYIDVIGSIGRLHSVACGTNGVD